MRFQSYLISEDREYLEYCHAIDYIFSEEYSESNLSEMINENVFARIKELVSGSLLTVFKSIKSEIESIAESIGIGVRELVDAFKQRDVFLMLKAIGFNIGILMKGIHQLTGLIRQGLLGIFKEIHDLGLVQRIKSGAMKVDDVLNKYPLLKKVSGIAVAGILFYIWLNMTFIGNLDYDFNFSDMVAALKGNYTISDMFISPEGLLLMTLFNTGSLISAPWLGSTMYNLILALTYTGYVHLKKNDYEVLRKLKSKIKTKSV